MVNNGLTPANDVRYVAKAQIVEVTTAFGKFIPLRPGRTIGKRPRSGPQGVSEHERCCFGLRR